MSERSANDVRRATFLTLAEWEAARQRQIMRRVTALLSLHREHAEAEERYLARAKEVGAGDG